MAENLFDELKRRKFFKVGAAYLLVAWLAVQGASIGFPGTETAGLLRVDPVWDPIRADPEFAALSEQP